MAGIIADRVIVSLEAKLGQYNANVLAAEKQFARSTSAIRREATRTEQQMRTSFDGVKRSLLGATALAAGAFGLNEIKNLADGYTSFTNRLKVAGLEGEALAGTQQKLFDIAQKYGQELGSIGTLYGGAAAAAKELGASQGQLIQFTNGVAAALKVQGGSAQSSAGALQQLSQLLGGVNVQAEEYNSINDGARPVLQAVANGIDRYGGSVAKLRAEVVKGKLTSQEFFAGFLKGSADLESKAAKANLTIGASFVVLNNALGKYIGQTDSSLSATARIGQAIKLLADNLDTIVPALATLVTLLGVRYVASAVAAAGATLVKAAADVRATQTAVALGVVQAELSGLMLAESVAADRAALAVTRLGVAGGVAARGLGALLGLVGGPIGAGVLALGAAFYLLRDGVEESQKATGAYAKAQAEASTITGQAASAAERLATAHGKARVEALALARAEAENIKQKLASARASVALAQAELARARASSAAALTRAQASLSFGGEAGALGASNTLNSSANAEIKAKANLDAANKTTADLSKALAGVTSAINGVATPSVSSAGKKTKGPKGATGKTAAEIEAEHDRELSRLATEELQARLDLTTDAQARADLQKQILDEERSRRIAEVEGNKELSRAQKDAQLTAIKRILGTEGKTAPDGSIIAEGRPGLLQQNVNREVEQERARMAVEALARQRDALESEAGLVESRSARLAIEKRINTMLADEERQRLEIEISTGQIAESEAEAARLALKRVQAARNETTARDAEGPLARYRRDLNNPDRANDAVEEAVVSELQGVRDGITNALQKTLGIKNPILAAILNSFIEQQLIAPLTQAFAGGMGGGGLLGGIGTFIGGLFGGRASGGHVAGGRMYRVTDGEGFQPAGSGKIIPLGRMNRSGGGGGTTIQQTFHIDASGVNPSGYAEGIVQRVRRETLAIVGGAVAGANQGVPGRMAEYSRDGR